MKRCSQLVILALLAGCSAKQGPSRALQQEATKAALQARLDQAEQEAAADLYAGVTDLSGVDLWDGKGKPISVAPEPVSDLVEASPVAVEAPVVVDPPAPEPKPATTEARPEAVVPVAPPAPIQPPPEVAVVVKPTPPPSTQAPPTPLFGAGVEPWLRQAPPDGATADALRELTRAIDDYRWHALLEARLADKQALWTSSPPQPQRAGAPLPPQALTAAPKEPSLAPKLAEVTTAQEQLAARVDSSLKSQEKTLQDGLNAITVAQAAEISALKDQHAAALAALEKQRAADLAALRAALEAKATQQPTPEPVTASTAVPASTTAPVSTAVPAPTTAPATQAAPSDETPPAWAQSLQERSALQAEQSDARSDAVTGALADLRAELKAVATEQAVLRSMVGTEAQRERRLFKWATRRDRDSTAPAVPPEPARPVESDETLRLSQQFAEAEARRKAESNEASTSIEELEERLRAFEADQSRLDALQVRVTETGGSSSELEEMKRSLAQLEVDRERLAGLQEEVAGLAEERTRLKEELQAADEARQAEIEVERGQTLARTEALNQELVTLRQRQAEMEGRYMDRQGAVLARLQPLVDSGLNVRMHQGRILVELPSDVLFASGSATLSAEGVTSVREVALALEPFPTLSVQVQGHTDNVPARSTKYPSNWDLAFARAKAVLQVFEAAGMPPQRISAASFGDARPIADNGTSEGRERNRRIELTLELPPLEE